mmetsp:Transcript_21654/g.32232  ORF Transcript_21654/g.32232 Transcript_21654/m.32232 type:complete len:164 (-) Transcript_21654:288-779(-)|eukprot:CAMPEP_0167757552 /NCGR_PEP_ID=MMETSP0110_2-20121227/9986_1 /TAXON_ID=629695 /ORGANISM="Gymnochlora sp., Strain CCMP2014" /LENGTH=163 /DNA_ID=CAMNT_0007643749 /DNA_START=77 /DNA_END=568 /DNA_ORIENTATION=+
MDDSLRSTHITKKDKCHANVMIRVPAAIVAGAYGGALAGGISFGIIACLVVTTAIALGSTVAEAYIRVVLYLFGHDMTELPAWSCAVMAAVVGTRCGAWFGAALGAASGFLFGLLKSLDLSDTLLSAFSNGAVTAAREGSYILVAIGILLYIHGPLESLPFVK